MQTLAERVETGNVRIAVIGCGIGGMAAALALKRAGSDVTIFEKFEAARPLGAGLLLQPTGLWALRELGLAETAINAGARVKRLDGRTPAGRLLLDLDYERWRTGAFGLGIHRASLFSVLHDAIRAEEIPVALNEEITNIAAPWWPTLMSASGARFGPYDLVIIADGAHSALRSTLMPQARAPIYPWGALWTILPDRNGEFPDTLRQIYRGTQMMIGVLPIGRDPASAEMMPAVSFFWSIMRKDFDAWRRTPISEWKKDVARVWPEAESLLAPVSAHDEISAATYSDVRMKTWRNGRLLFLGDAAHGMSPQLGQGANLALIDAVLLADTLKRADRARESVEHALYAFERRRRAHVNYYLYASRWLTPFFQSNSRLASAFRNVAFPLARNLPFFPGFMMRTLVGVQRLSFRPFPVP